MRRTRPYLKRLRDWLVFRLARLLLFLGRHIPVSIGYALGEVLGSAAFVLAKGEREKALKNLRIGLGEDLSERELQIVARGMFAHFGRVLFEVLRVPRLSREEVKSCIRFEGLGYVNDALEEGRGVVVATGHIGNWELFGAAASILGMPLNVIAREIKDPRLNELLVRLRRRAGVVTILRESSNSAKEILRCLRRGELLALLIDQDIKVEGAFVPFFDRPAFTPIGAAALAHRTNALFLAAAIHRLGPGRHVVRVAPIEFSAELDRYRAIIDATARATAQLEKWIRERPEQWAWNHERWRTRPDDL